MFFNYQTTFTFFKTTGDLTTRFNASLNVPIEYQWYWIILFTFGLVVSRFLLNNVIYYIRELIDNFTQGTLTKHEHKSFTSDKDHQKLKVKASLLQSDLFSSQDRETLAREAEKKANNANDVLRSERDAHKKSYLTELHNASTLKTEVDSLKEKGRGAIDEIESLKDIIQDQILDKLKLDDQLRSSLEGLSIISERLNDWSAKANNKDIMLIGKPESSGTVEGKQALDRILNSKVISRSESSKYIDINYKGLGQDNGAHTGLSGLMLDQTRTTSERRGLISQLDKPLINHLDIMTKQFKRNNS